jgi:uncharacterized protein
VHVHAEAATAAQGDIGASASRYFGRSTVPTSLDELAAYYRARKMACVAAAAHPDVLVPFVSVDPTRGREAVEEASR